MKYFIYIHRRASDKVIFYVGKGCRYRHKSKWGRSDHWHNIVNKHGFIAEILYKNLSEEEAFVLEIETIEKFKDNNLCNKTKGGPGAKGCVVSNATKEIHKFQRSSQEWRENLKIKAKERYKNKDFREAHAKRASKIMENMEVRKKISDSLKEYNKSKEVKELAAKRTKEYFKDPRNRYKHSLSCFRRFDTPEKRAAHPQAKKIKCVELNVVFGTGTLAAEWVSSIIGKKADNSSIAKAARKKVTAYGYHWEYV